MQIVEIINGVPYLTAQYDQSINLLSVITATTAVTLPLSASYFGSELLVILNGQVLGYSEDYYYVGAGPTYTQVAFYNDLQIGDILRFRK